MAARSSSAVTWLAAPASPQCAQQPGRGARVAEVGEGAQQPGHGLRVVEASVGGGVAVQQRGTGPVAPASSSACSRVATAYGSSRLAWAAAQSAGRWSPGCRMCSNRTRRAPARDRHGRLPACTGGRVTVQAAVLGSPGQREQVGRVGIAGRGRPEGLPVGSSRAEHGGRAGRGSRPAARPGRRQSWPGHAGRGRMGASGPRTPFRAGGVVQRLLQPVAGQQVPFGVGQVPGRRRLQEGPGQGGAHAQAGRVHRGVNQRPGGRGCVRYRSSSSGAPARYWITRPSRLPAAACASRGSPAFASFRNWSSLNSAGTGMSWPASSSRAWACGSAPPGGRAVSSAQ